MKFCNKKKLDFTNDKTVQSVFFLIITYTLCKILLFLSRLSGVHLSLELVAVTQ